MGQIRLNRQLNRALYFAALERAATEQKDIEKDLVVETLKADDMGQVLEVKNGKITFQERSDLSLNIAATYEAIKSGVLSLDIFLQHVKPSASLKIALGQTLTDKLMTQRSTEVWMLKPNEATKERASASFAEFVE